MEEMSGEGCSCSSTMELSRLNQLDGGCGFKAQSYYSPINVLDFQAAEEGGCNTVLNFTYRGKPCDFSHYELSS